MTVLLYDSSGEKTVSCPRTQSTIRCLNIYLMPHLLLALQCFALKKTAKDFGSDFDAQTEDTVNVGTFITTGMRQFGSRDVELNQVVSGLMHNFHNRDLAHPISIIKTKLSSAVHTHNTGFSVIDNYPVMHSRLNQQLYSFIRLGVNHGKRWRLYILPQYLANLTQPQ